MTRNDNLRKFNKRYLETLKQMKKTENENGEMTPGRRRWFNKEIQRIQEKLNEV